MIARIPLGISPEALEITLCADFIRSRVPRALVVVGIEERSDQLHDQGRKELYSNRTNAFAFMIGSEYRRQCPHRGAQALS